MRRMRTNLVKGGTIGAAIVCTLAASGCRGNDAEPLPSPPAAVPTSTAAASAAPSALPSGSPTEIPSVAGTLTVGAASVTTTGALNTTAIYDTLSSGVWALPPGAMSLSWRAKGRQALSITGASFTAQVSTDVDRVLAFSVPGTDGLETFSSSAGECLVTISPAFADQIGGTFTCVAIANDDGSLTVNAQGSFSAE